MIARNNHIISSARTITLKLSWKEEEDEIFLGRFSFLSILRLAVDEKKIEKFQRTFMKASQRLLKIRMELKNE